MVKVAMIGHKDFPSRSGGVEVMVGGLARSLVERGYDVTVYNRGLEKHHNVYDVDGVHARRVFTLQKPALNATTTLFWRLLMRCSGAMMCSITTPLGPAYRC